MRHSASTLALALAVMIVPLGFGGFYLAFAQEGAKVGDQQVGTAREASTKSGPRGPELALPVGARRGGRLIDNQRHAYLGVRECNLCHGRGLRKEEEKYDYLVRLNEEVVWAVEDKHRIAAETLKPDGTVRNLAFHMQSVLGADRFAKLLHKCKACHDPTEPATSKVRGVTCEACHGPGEDWNEPHRQVAWRLKSLKEQQDAGMVNVHDPATKTKMCLSCHLGSVAEGRVLTHEMYAAGHPPLPGFETSTFSLAMPAHWTSMKSKPEDYQRHHGRYQVYAANTHELLHSALASVEHYLDLLAAYADSAETESPWPELALYDCFACHHDLRQDSWRQRRDYAKYRPGRPPLRAWPNVLAELALGQPRPQAPLSIIVEGIGKPLDERPFGERKELGAAASSAADDLRGAVALLRDQLNRSSLTADEAQRQDRALVNRLLTSVCELATTKEHDYDSARQLVWAFERIHEDYKQLNPEARKNNAVEKALTQLNGDLKGELIKGQQPIGEPGTLAAFLEARSRYDPQQFSAQFERLQELIREKGVGSRFSPVSP